MTDGAKLTKDIGDAIEALRTKAELIKDNVSSVLVGQEERTKLILTALLAGGHVLLEDKPGTGKTMLAKTFAESIGGEFKRIQFTPDLMPADITGLKVYNRKNEEFELVKGPAFTDILLADEINRAAPRTQSGLLQAMEEKQLTIDRDTYTLSDSFFVIATQNPLEHAGTYPLPEAMLDRFIMKLGMQDIDREDEIKVLERFMKDNPYERIKPVCTVAEIEDMKMIVKSVKIAECVVEYMVDCVNAIREDRRARNGISTRASLAIMRSAQAYAAIDGRDYVTPDDIRYLLPFVMCHRMGYGLGVESSKNELNNIHEIISGIDVPVEKWNN